MCEVCDKAEFDTCPAHTVSHLLCSYRRGVLLTDELCNIMVLSTRIVPETD